MKVSRMTMVSTVKIMHESWSSIVRRTGQLTPDDMVHTLRAAKNRGLNVTAATSQSTLAKLNHLFIGEEELL